jgi:Tfp pilus assembly protein PilF
MPALCLLRASRYDESLRMLVTCVQTPGIGIEDLREACRTAMQVTIATDDPETLRQVDVILATALTKEPEADEFLVMQAMLRHLQRKFDDEVRLYRVVLEHRPESYVVLNNLAWALSEGLDHPEEARTYIDRLVKTVTDQDAQAVDTRGMILSRLSQSPQGRSEEERRSFQTDAIRDLENVVKSEPSTQHYFHLARVYDRAGRKEEARRSFVLALQGIPQGGAASSTPGETRDPGATGRGRGLTRRDVDTTEKDDFDRLSALYQPLPPGSPVAGTSKPPGK